MNQEREKAVFLAMAGAMYDQAIAQAAEAENAWGEFRKMQKRIDELEATRRQDWEDFKTQGKELETAREQLKTAEAKAAAQLKALELHTSAERAAYAARDEAREHLKAAENQVHDLLAGQDHLKNECDRLAAQLATTVGELDTARAELGDALAAAHARADRAESERNKIAARMKLEELKPQ